MRDFFKYFLLSAILFFNSNAVLAESYIVKLKNPQVGAASLDAGRHVLDAVSKLGGHIKSTIPISTGYLFAVVDIDEAKVLKLQSDNAVEALEKDQTVKAFRVPNDYYYAEQWGLGRVGAEAAWDRSTGKSGDVVAVLDTGIDIDHPDLYRNIWMNSDEIDDNGIDDDKNGFIDDANGWNFISNNNDVNDDSGHGTHVAGIVAAVGDNGRGVAGVSYDSRLLSIKVLDSKGQGLVSSIINGIIYTTNLKARGRANIIAINLSLGLNGESNALKEAIQYAGAYGISVITAAGNDGTNNDITPVSPANLAVELDNVISVAALNQTGALATFSNYGEKYVTVAAPGERILSTIPYDEKTGYAYAFFDGTSMATPFVTGAIGLIKGINPSLSPKSIKKIILNGPYNSLLS